MAATIKELLDNNPQWSHEEACAAECGWTAAIEHVEALKPSHNKQSTPCEHDMVAVSEYRCNKCGWVSSTCYE